MNEKYWDGVAATYDEDVFNTLANDRNGTIVRHIDRIASGSASVADFGCGTGKYVGLLSAKFKTVNAIDHSNKLLDIARRSFAHLANVSFIKADLSAAKLKLPPVEAAIAINVLLTPDVSKRTALLRNVYRTLKRGGRLVMVVPALESIIYSIARLAEWNRRSSTQHSGFSAEAVSGSRKMRRALFEGVVYLEDQVTKHFMRDELELLIASVGFEVDSVGRVEYSWGYEFENPPRWMKGPYPWDWITVCRKP